MKFFTDLLFTQYYELKSKGRSTTSAKNTGILLLSVLIILFFLTVFMAINATGAFQFTSSSPMSGRAAGRVFGLVGLGVAFGTLYMLFGKQEKYEAIIKSYEDLSEEAQIEIYKRGMKRFLIAFCIMIILIIVFAVI